MVKTKSLSWTPPPPLKGSKGHLGQIQCIHMTEMPHSIWSDGETRGKGGGLRTAVASALLLVDTDHDTVLFLAAPPCTVFGAGKGFFFCVGGTNLNSAKNNSSFTAETQTSEFRQLSSEVFCSLDKLRNISFPEATTSKTVHQCHICRFCRSPCLLFCLAELLLVEQQIRKQRYRFGFALR